MRGLFRKFLGTPYYFFGRGLRKLGYGVHLFRGGGGSGMLVVPMAGTPSGK
jgi:hypothetical protein